MILDSLKTSNMEGITFADEGPFIIATKNKLIVKPSDFKGLKVRTSGHPIMEAGLRMVGASTTKISLREVYTSAQQGVINACGTTLSAYIGQHLYEVLPYVTLWPGGAAYVSVACRSWWNGLRPFDRYVLDICAKEKALEYNAAAWENKDRFVKKLTAHGGKYHEFSEAELKKIHSQIQPLYDKLRKEFGATVDNILATYLIGLARTI